MHLSSSYDDCFNVMTKISDQILIQPKHCRAVSMIFFLISFHNRGSSTTGKLKLIKILLRRSDAVCAYGLRCTSVELAIGESGYFFNRGFSSFQFIVWLTHVLSFEKRDFYVLFHEMLTEHA